MSDLQNVNIRVFNEIEAKRVIEELVSYMRSKDPLEIQVASWWGGGQRWARNQSSLSADQREVTVAVSRRDRIRANTGISASMNQTDSTSLKAIAEHIEFYAPRRRSKAPQDRMLDVPRSDAKGADVWSDETFNRSVIENASAVETLTLLSEAEQLVSSGYIETTGATSLKYSRDDAGRIEYEWGEVTQTQCSTTVRHPRGTASSWAGKTSFDINRVDIAGIARLAFEKCKKSFDPVRIEPGRYQTILEPQASATLFNGFFKGLARYEPEQTGKGPMFLGMDHAVQRFRSKLGLKVLDERISIFHEPADPFVGTHFAPLHKRIDLVTKGILTGMMDSYISHLNEHSDIPPAFYTTSYSVSSGEFSLDDMISSTERGLLVVKLAMPVLIDWQSLLHTGVTRDGLWLIEGGKITKSVRNFRWTESPLFAFNNVEQIGRSEQVFDPIVTRNPFGKASYALSLNNVVVPPIKVNDFSFTSTIDAI